MFYIIVKYIYKGGGLMSFKILLGMRIKSIRKELNISQGDFCKRLNIELSIASLSKIEKGQQLPSAEFIKAVIEAFKISPYWLLDIEVIKLDDKFKRFDLLDEDEKDNVFNYIEFLINMRKKIDP